MPADSNRKRYLHLAVSALLAASVVALFLQYRNEVLEAFVGFQISWIIVGLVCFLINYLARATRMHYLTNKALAVFPDGLYCSSLHGFATYMLPVRTGELSLPFILKSRVDIDLKKGLKILYKARLLDVLTMGGWLFVAAVIPGTELAIKYKLSMALMGGVMLVTPFALRKIACKNQIRFWRIGDIFRSVADYSHFSRIEILISISIWVASAAMLWCITTAMNMDLSLDQLFFLVAIQLVMQLLPIQGIANSGNHEGAWVGAMVAIGYPVGVSMQFAIASHAVIMSFVLLLGVLASVLRHFLIE